VFVHELTIVQTQQEKQKYQTPFALEQCYRVEWKKPGVSTYTANFAKPFFTSYGGVIILKIGITKKKCLRNYLEIVKNLN
jgi:hypothetical protein